MLTNYKVTNTINAIENSATLNLVAANPGSANTLWIDSTLGHLHRGSIDLEEGVTSTFVPTITPLEVTPNTYTNILSMYIKFGNKVFVWCCYKVVGGGGVPVASANITLPFSSASTPIVIFSPKISSFTNTIGPSGVRVLNIIANNTSSTINVQTSISLGVETHTCVLNYAYVI